MFIVKRFCHLIITMARLNSHSRKSITWLLLSFVVSHGVYAENTSNTIEQKRITDDDAVAAFRWIAETKTGVRFTFAQRIPDQTRSFYLARGFPSPASSLYATACIYQVILNNDSKDRVVKIDLADWRVIYNGKKKPIKLESDWQKTWQEMNISKSSRIAFRWSQFPKIQKHKPGDWFQGMAAADLPPSTEFDLYIKWLENDKPHDAIIHKLQCAADRNLEM
jgi:hypothetical protein